MSDSQDIVKLTKAFTSELAHLNAVRTWTRDACRDHLPEIDDILINYFQIAAVEVFTNIVKHGLDADPNHNVTFEITVTTEDIEIVISDDGRSFDPNTLEDPDLSEGREDGMGIYIIKQVMDSVVYHSKDSTRSKNRLHLVKKLD